MIIDGIRRRSSVRSAFRLHPLTIIGAVRFQAASVDDHRCGPLSGCIRRRSSVRSAFRLHPSTIIGGVRLQADHKI
jgi:hypothetical protein